MNISNELTRAVTEAVKVLYETDIDAQQVQLQKTKREFEGHLTLVVFPFVRVSRKRPEETAEEIGHMGVFDEWQLDKGAKDLGIFQAIGETIVGTDGSCLLKIFQTL